MINNSAKSKGVTFAPAFAQPNISSAIIIVLGLNRGRGGKSARRRNVGRCAIVDCLIGKPCLCLQEPVVAELMLVSKSYTNAIDPVMIIGREGGIGVRVVLLNGDTSRISDADAITVNIKGP